MTDKRFNRKKKIKALINDPYYQPMKQREIGYLMQVAPEDRDEFVEILNELVEEGSIEVSKRGKYMPPSEDSQRNLQLYKQRLWICNRGRGRR